MIEQEQIKLEKKYLNKVLKEINSQNDSRVVCIISSVYRFASVQLVWTKCVISRQPRRTD